MLEGWHERTRKSKLCCESQLVTALLCVHFHLLGEKVEKFGKHYYLLLNCVYWMVWIAIAQSFTHYASSAFNVSIRINE